LLAKKLSVRSGTSSAFPHRLGLWEARTKLPSNDFAPCFATRRVASCERSDRRAGLVPGNYERDHIHPSESFGRPLIMQRLVPITAAQYPTLAHRLAYSVLSSECHSRIFKVCLPDWRVQMRSASSDLLFCLGAGASRSCPAILLAPAVSLARGHKRLTCPE